MGYKIQHGKQSSQRTHMHGPWTWATVWGLPEGVEGDWEGQKGEEWGQL